MTVNREQHYIEHEGTAYDVDQPIGWRVVCTCGEEETHCSPDGARAWHARHLREVSFGRLEAADA